MARGRWPAARHDGAAWRASDHMRAASGGNALGWVGAILFIKCDMMEFVTTFGFPSWMTVMNPCPLCKCTRLNMGEIAGVSLRALPWELKLWQDYVNACQACETWIDITEKRTLREIRVALAYDKSKEGSRGRALTKSFPTLVPPLRAGDRLALAAAAMRAASEEQASPEPADIRGTPGR